MSKANRERFLLLSRKANIAGKRFRKDLVPVLSSAIRKVAEAVQERSAMEVKAERAMEEMYHELMKVKEKHVMPMAIDGYKIGEKLIGKSAPHYDSKAIFVKPFNEVYGDDAFIAKRLRPNLSKWIESTSKQETKWYSQRIAGIINRTFQGEFGTPSAERAAQVLLEKGLADSESRANLMARTASNWAYNEGAETSFIADGYTLGVWVTNSDEPCEFCQAMEGTYFELGRGILKAGARITGTEGRVMQVQVDTAHPPLHPNCYCTIMPDEDS